MVVKNKEYGAIGVRLSVFRRIPDRNIQQFFGCLGANTQQVVSGYGYRIRPNPALIFRGTGLNPVIKGARMIATAGEMSAVLQMRAEGCQFQIPLTG